MRSDRRKGFPDIGHVTMRDCSRHMHTQRQERWAQRKGFLSFGVSVGQGQSSLTGFSSLVALASGVSDGIQKLGNSFAFSLSPASGPELGPG